MKESTSKRMGNQESTPEDGGGDHGGRGGNDDASRDKDVIATHDTQEKVGEIENNHSNVVDEDDDDEEEDDNDEKASKQINISSSQESSPRSSSPQDNNKRKLQQHVQNAKTAARTKTTSGNANNNDDSSSSDLEEFQDCQENEDEGNHDDSQKNKQHKRNSRDDHSPMFKKVGILKPKDIKDSASSAHKHKKYAKASSSASAGRKGNSTSPVSTNKTSSKKLLSSSPSSNKKEDQQNDSKSKIQKDNNGKSKPVRKDSNSLGVARHQNGIDKTPHQKKPPPPSSTQASSPSSVNIATSTVNNTQQQQQKNIDPSRRIPGKTPEYEGPPDDPIAGGWPKDWIKRTYKRNSAAYSGHTDRYWYTPGGLQLRSLVEAKKFMKALRQNNGNEEKAFEVFKKIKLTDEDKKGFDGGGGRGRPKKVINSPSPSPAPTNTAASVARAPPTQKNSPQLPPTSSTTKNNPSMAATTSTNNNSNKGNAKYIPWQFHNGKKTNALRETLPKGSKEWKEEWLKYAQNKFGLPDGWDVTYYKRTNRKIWHAPDGKSVDTLPRAIGMSVKKGWLPPDTVVPGVEKILQRKVAAAIQQRQQGGVTKPPPPKKSPKKKMPTKSTNNITTGNNDGNKPPDPYAINTHTLTIGERAKQRRCSGSGASLGEKPFLEKVFDILNRSDSDPTWKSIISWIDNGTAFQIFKPEEFESSVLPAEAMTSDVSMFCQYLPWYGFERIGDGKYRHEKFTRNNRDESIGLIRQKHPSVWKPEFSNPEGRGSKGMTSNEMECDDYGEQNGEEHTEEAEEAGDNNKQQHPEMPQQQHSRRSGRVIKRPAKMDMLFDNTATSAKSYFPTKHSNNDSPSNNTPRKNQMVGSKKAVNPDKDRKLEKNSAAWKKQNLDYAKQKFGLPDGWDCVWDDAQGRKYWHAPDGKRTDTLPRALKMCRQRGWILSDVEEDESGDSESDDESTVNYKPNDWRVVEAAKRQRLDKKKKPKGDDRRSDANEVNSRAWKKRSLKHAYSQGLPRNVGWDVEYHEELRRKYWLAPDGSRSDSIPRAIAMSHRKGWMNMERGEDDSSSSSDDDDDSSSASSSDDEIDDELGDVALPFLMRTVKCRKCVPSLHTLVLSDDDEYDDADPASRDVKAILSKFEKKLAGKRKSSSSSVSSEIVPDGVDSSPARATNKRLKTSMASSPNSADDDVDHAEAATAKRPRTKPRSGGARSIKQIIVNGVELIPENMPSRVKPIYNDTARSKTYKGVTGGDSGSSWIANISIPGKGRLYLGSYATELQAACMFAWAHLIMHGGERTREAEQKGEKYRRNNGLPIHRFPPASSRNTNPTTAGGNRIALTREIKEYIDRRIGSVADKRRMKAFEKENPNLSGEIKDYIDNQIQFKMDDMEESFNANICRLEFEFNKRLSDMERRIDAGSVTSAVKVRKQSARKSIAGSSLVIPTNSNAIAAAMTRISDASRDSQARVDALSSGKKRKSSAPVRNVKRPAIMPRHRYNPNASNGKRAGDTPYNYPNSPSHPTMTQRPQGFPKATIPQHQSNPSQQYGTSQNNNSTRSTNSTNRKANPGAPGSSQNEEYLIEV